MKTLIKTLANEFGFNQQQMADFFGINRSIISRIQSGERTLPGKAIQQGALLLQAIQRMERSIKKSKPAEQANMPLRTQLLQEQILDCRLQIRQVQSSLQQLKQEHHKCDKSSTLVRHISEITSPETAARQHRWLAEVEYQNEQASKKCDAEQQWLLDIKLQGLAAQLAYYEQQLSVIKNQINNP